MVENHHTITSHHFVDQEFGDSSIGKFFLSLSYWLGSLCSIHLGWTALEVQESLFTGPVPYQIRMKPGLSWLPLHLVSGPLYWSLQQGSQTIAWRLSTSKTWDRRCQFSERLDMEKAQCHFNSTFLVKAVTNHPRFKGRENRSNFQWEECERIMGNFTPPHWPF